MTNLFLQKKPVLQFNLNYKIPYFVPWNHSSFSPNLINYSKCREICCSWIKNLFIMYSENDKSIPDTISICIFFKSMYGNADIFIPKIENTIKNIEDKFLLGRNFKAHNIQNLVEIGSEVRGNHILLRMEIGKAWFKSPVLLSLFLLLIRIIYIKINIIPSTGYDYDTLIKCKGDFVGKFDLKILQEQNNIFNFINEHISDDIVSNYTNKVFGYGFTEFLKEFKGEI